MSFSNRFSPCPLFGPCGADRRPPWFNAREKPRMNEKYRRPVMTGEHVMGSLPIGPVSCHDLFFFALSKSQIEQFFRLGLMVLLFFFLFIPTGSDSGRTGPKYAREERGESRNKGFTSAEAVKYLRPTPFHLLCT
ncbi:hypothetical protein BO99DRAFT_169416 [Aspergillus violaceofuscus CBS 115571]|uniref:Uncharacterized protein n=1 Tax=Aspergillus violaceofuscus (strain CBS 115571) TaxID=1450538 RepID=A0A2V5H7W0_ASPV1|nr:hypothetical protein BO99DRAFT_169416 [Aspergillus violaceofuscus CBS 115571]